jgi:hypothetical protein
VKLSESYWILIALIGLPFLMMPGCVNTDVLVMKPCEKKEKSGREEKIVMLLGKDNQNHSVTVTQVNYPGKEVSGKGICQARDKQTCILGLWCLKD